MTILVTGATGYIGYEFVKKMQYKYNIIALVRKNSDISKLKQLKCCIYNDMNKIFSKNSLKGVVHFASNVMVEHQSKDIDSLINSNIVFGVKLLQYCKKYQIKWFINTGTFWQNYNNVEDYNPVNLYASTKEAFEVMAKYYVETSNLIFTTIKLNDTFGSNDKRKKIFNLWLNAIQTNIMLDMSKGEQIIDISYIDDIINAYEIMIENLSKNNYVKYNLKKYMVTNQDKLTLKELAKLFEKLICKKIPINWDKKEYRTREIMVPYNKGKLVPNWKQKYSLERAIKLILQERKND